MKGDSQTLAQMVIEVFRDWFASLGAVAWVAMGLVLFAGLAMGVWTLSWIYRGRARRQRRGWLRGHPPGSGLS